ncbi:MAG TPA: response regulator [Leptolyngbyaceae cyanobacterium]
MSKEHRVTVLHIDDNEANRYIVSRMLRNAGFEVMESSTGHTGLQLAREAQPDLIILDVKLPDIGGFEVCRRVKAHPATSSIPVLHLSAKFIKSEDKAQGLEGGADAYLAQPVEPIELIATIKALLRIRKAEESALALAREWKTTFDAISDGVCLLNKEGKIVRYNQGFQSLLQIERLSSAFCSHAMETSSEEKDDQNVTPLGEEVDTSLKLAENDLVQELFPHLTDGQNGISKVNIFQLIQETKARESLELQLEERWFSVTADPMFDRQENFTGAVYILADITDRVKAQEALRVSEERFRLLLENVEDYAIFFLDIDGRVIRWSTGAERIIGYQTREILGKFASIIFTPEDLELGADRQELAIAIAEGRAEDERWHLRKNGTRFWGSGMVTPLRDDSGQLRGFAKIMRDFTERKRAEDERNLLLAREQEARAQAETANRMKDEFLATLSHELRSPLNAMLGWAQLLNSRRFDEQTFTKAIDIIERTARVQAQLVDDLLDVSRIIQGKLLLNVRPVELATIIGAVLDTIRPAAQAKGIELQSFLDPVTGLVVGDSDRLQQVIWNLISNAIKFTPNGGQVEVRLEKVNSQVQITVKDTGKGISADFVPYVFERFRQADSSMTRAYNGLGLGLAIVRHLVELHGGTVRAESEGEDLGATFIVSFPIMSVRKQENEWEQLSQEIDNSENSPSLDGLRVLLVDDDPDTRFFLCTALTQWGAKAIEASSVEEAMKALEQWKPDVLISDIGMPEEDGYSLIRKVRSLSAEQGGLIPAAALTAYARTEDRTRSLLEGFQIHVPKPVEPNELVAVVATLAGRVSKF